MSIIEQIADLMLREGEIKAQQAREKVAADEELRQNKHRKLKMTLKALATFGPMFIPGVGPWASLGIGAGQNIARNTVFKDPNSGGWTY